MNLIRSILFQIFFAIWTALFSTLMLPLVALNRMRAPLFIGQTWARVTLIGLKVICGIDYRIEGQEHMPTGPSIFACNHQSAWETLALLMLIHRPCFIFKKELLWVPFLGFYLKTLGMIAIDRKKGVKALTVLNKEAAKAVAEGRTIILFPEGTRVKTGETKPFQRGIVPMCKALKVPVIPAAHNAGRFWPRDRFTKTPGTVVLRVFPPLPAETPAQEIPARLEEIIHPAIKALCD